MVTAMKKIDVLLQVYSDETPALLKELCNAPALRRIDGIDMNCGMNYTSHPLFRSMSPYSRLRHSIGTALIIDHFTHDEKMMAAGLFHDIATPVFSHVIDFVNGDYEKQESTEEKTTEIIMHDACIMQVLEREGISLAEVDDYHIYPIADNATPKLSADRLEYSLSNMVNYGFATIEQAMAYYRDLVVLENEEGIAEIGFLNAETAAEFTKHVLLCSHVYSSDFDRYAMDELASLLKDALHRHVITTTDLYQDSEAVCIEKLCRDEKTNRMWQSFTALHKVVRCDTHTDGSRIIPAKKRWIDPLVKGRGRISEINRGMRNEIETYQNTAFTYAVIKED